MVEKTTLHVRTAAVIQQILSSAEDQASFAVLSNPDRMLIGGAEPAAIEAQTAIYQQWVPPECADDELFETLLHRGEKAMNIPPARPG